MPTGVFAVLLLEALGRLLEPVDLAGFDPVVARVMALVRAVGMAIQEIDGEGRVVRGRLGQDFDVVVAHAVHILGAGNRKGVGQSFHDGHLRFARHCLFIVVVAKDGGMRDLALGKEGRVLEHGLGGVSAT